MRCFGETMVYSTKDGGIDEYKQTGKNVDK